MVVGLVLIGRVLRCIYQHIFSLVVLVQVQHIYQHIEHWLAVH